MNYYEINEDTARRAKQMRSFDDYCEGSATWHYRSRCDEAAALAEQVKAERCKTAAQREHIDYLLNRYCKVLAEATNKDNEIGTRCPSVMISGGGNFPVAKKEKQIAASTRADPFSIIIISRKGVILRVNDYHKKASRISTGGKNQGWICQPRHGSDGRPVFARNYRAARARGHRDGAGGCSGLRGLL